MARAIPVPTIVRRPHPVLVLRPRDSLAGSGVGASGIAGSGVSDGSGSGGAGGARSRRILTPHSAVSAAYLHGRRWPPAPLDGYGGSRRLGLGDLSSTATSTIAATIQRVEGYYPGSLAYRNNNPGNLVYVGQAGAVQGAGGFASFSSYQDGLDALYRQIQLYAGRGLTISQMMEIYAPSSDPRNNPGAYAAEIAGALGVSPSSSLSDLTGADSWIGPGALDVVAPDGSPYLLVGLGAAALLLLWIVL